MPRFGYRLRSAAGGKSAALMGLQYRHAGATRRMTLGPEAVLNAEQARARLAGAGPMLRTATTRKPTSRIGATRTGIRSRPPSPTIWRSRSARFVRAPSPRNRAISPATYFKPLHGLALDQITRTDVATRLNRITVESSSTVAALARAQFARCSLGPSTQGLTEANPVVGTDTPKGGKPRERVLSDAELPASGRRAATTIMAGASGS